MDIAEQLKRIADALEAQNTLNQEIFEYSKQIRTEEMAQQAAEHELSQKFGPIKGGIAPDVSIPTWKTIC